ncbi:IS5 family transposase [Streptomyces sp. NPDC006668]|uniref:IS5 family transposase n=1 Tax=Streptomyces sp. NPDC006668 TaxID=3156903 RepID=UPI0033F5D180
MEFVDRLSQVNKSVWWITEADLLPPGAARGPSSKIIRVGDHGVVVRRHELTDQEWELLAPLIPRAAVGRPRMEDRQVINGMVCKIRTGISWRDLPERYGPRKAVYTRFRRYALDGVFTQALQQIQAHADAARHRLAGPDRLHRRPRSPARRHHEAKRGRYRQDEPDDHVLGRSRGEPTTKIHFACDGKGRPLAIRVPRTGTGRPRCRPDRVIAEGLQLPRLPCLPATTRHCAHHPRED